MLIKITFNVTQETVFSHAKTQSNAKSFLLTTRGHTIKHDIPYYCTFHAMATRSFARWPTEFKHDVYGWRVVTERV